MEDIYEDLKHDDLTLTIEEQDKRIILKWVGDSRDVNPGSILNPFLKKIVDSIKDKSLVVDFRKLQSMNSSTVLPILRFIKSLEAASINTEIIYDNMCSWQRASFIPLSAITKFYKYIKVNKAVPE